MDSMRDRHINPGYGLNIDDIRDLREWIYPYMGFPRYALNTDDFRDLHIWVV